MQGAPSPHASGWGGASAGKWKPSPNFLSVQIKMLFGFLFSWTGRKVTTVPQLKWPQTGRTRRGQVMWKSAVVCTTTAILRKLPNMPSLGQVRDEPSRPGQWKWPAHLPLGTPTASAMLAPRWGHPALVAMVVDGNWVVPMSSGPKPGPGSLLTGSTPLGLSPGPDSPVLAPIGVAWSRDSTSKDLGGLQKMSTCFPVSLGSSQSYPRTLRKVHSKGWTS